MGSAAQAFQIADWISFGEPGKCLTPESAVKDFIFFGLFTEGTGEMEIIESVARAGYMRASWGYSGGPDPSQGVHTD
jgi:hypothetical protein